MVDTINIPAVAGNGLPGSMPAPAAPGLPGASAPPAAVAGGPVPTAVPGQQWAGRFDSPQALEASYKELQGAYTRGQQQLAAYQAGAPPVAAAPVALAAPAAMPAGYAPAPVAAPAGFAPAVAPVPGGPQAPAPNPHVAPQPAPQFAPQASPQNPTPQQPAALNLAPYYQEYANTGGLSEVSIQQISQSMGVDRGTIMQHLQGAASHATLVQQSAHTRVGGEAQFNALMGWAAQNLPQDSAIINGYLTSGQMDQWNMAIDGLQQRYFASQGQDPLNPVGGFNGYGTGTGVQGFKDHTEMVHAMNVLDERGQNRYETDPAYRKQVELRVAAQAFEGIQTAPVNRI